MTIKQKQNEVELLEVQYSARTLYNIAEGLNIGAWIIAVLWAIFESYIAEGCGITITYMLIINMSIIIITIFFQAGVRSCTKYAAGLRMYFDYQLFGWESEEYQECSKQSLKDIVYKILSLRKKDSAIRMRNTGIQNPRGVKDWYTSSCDIDNRNKSIMCCQNENMWWTKEIAKTQKYFRYVIIGIVTFLSIYLLRNETVVGVLMKFLPIAPLLIELIVEVLRANRQMKIFSEYEGKREIINYSTEIRECDLRNLQKSIDERRLIPIITINKIHDVLSTKFHERYSRITR